MVYAGPHGHIAAATSKHIAAPSSRRDRPGQGPRASSTEADGQRRRKSHAPICRAKRAPCSLTSPCRAQTRQCARQSRAQPDGTRGQLTDSRDGKGEAGRRWQTPSPHPLQRSVSTQGLGIDRAVSIPYRSLCPRCSEQVVPQDMLACTRSFRIMAFSCLFFPCDFVAPTRALPSLSGNSCTRRGAQRSSRAGRMWQRQQPRKRSAGGGGLARVLYGD